MDGFHKKLTALRHDFHRYPELGFQEARTKAKVAAILRDLGLEVHEGVGVVGILRAGGGNRAIGLRADMDALPIEEATGLPYASKTPGVMHACGHDGHTAMLLGAAKYLAETRNFDGTVAVIFQPAEEGGGGGLEMCKDGMMERFGIDEVYGMHNWPGRPIGTFAIRPGPFFAATDTFEIVIEGKGGHAAKPNETVDSIVMAAQCVTTLQTIAARNADPVEQIVVSVTSFESSSKAFNVIPQSVTFRGTVRTLTPEMRALGRDRIHDICTHTAAVFGGVAHITYIEGYPATVNHEAETKFAAEAATKVAGDCDFAPLVMGGEDFSYMLEERPGAYILMGNGDGASVHHPEYNFNDEAIPAGCSWWVEMAETRLGTAQ